MKRHDVGRRFRRSIAGPLLLALTTALSAAPPTVVGPDAKALKQSRQRAINFLRSSQAEDGSWTSPAAPGITALCTTALLRSGLKPDDPAVVRGLKHLGKLVRKDGGIYYPRTLHKNYETSIAILAFHAANSDGRYDKIIAGGRKFLIHLQWDEGEGLESSDPAYGGAGYGKHQRPDLSNTQFFQEALVAAGLKSDDPAMKKILVFVSRCQNLETEHNTLPFAAKENDGGVIYTPVGGGKSQAGLTAGGGLRSYGSMTYAGLKSMIFAGVNRDDPRVQAALGWIRRYYSVRANPGLGQQGLYYYLHTFAKSLSALKIDRLEDSNGVRHDWRHELADELGRQQKPNGSWVNRAPRWYEGDPNLVTSYALLALSYCDPRPPRKQPPGR